MTHFALGNSTHGYFEGQFPTENLAWLWLSRRFLISFARDAASAVSLFSLTADAKGQTHSQQLKHDKPTWDFIHSDDNVSDAEVLQKCTRRMASI